MIKIIKNIFRNVDSFAIKGVYYIINKKRKGDRLYENLSNKT